MKSYLYFISLLVIALLMFSGCEKSENRTASVTFGANYHVVNCITYVTVYLDGKKLGKLETPADSITECGQTENITKEVFPGKHFYKVEIRSEMGTGLKKDIKGEFRVGRGECYKVFIDYFKIDW